MVKSKQKVAALAVGCAKCGEVHGCNHSAAEYQGQAQREWSKLDGIAAPQFFYLELPGNHRRSTFLIIEKSVVSDNKFNEVARLSSEKQVRRMLKLLNALPEDMTRNSI